MLFIYWGWDTAVTVNEETTDSRRTPGRAGAYLHAAAARALPPGHRRHTAFAGTGATGSA